jgi:Arc/MetJ-type ribon-helix-helix transcriptional regulator
MISIEEVYIFYVYLKPNSRKIQKKGHRMPEWTTISLREELIEEVRRLVKKTGRYRSISEFVAEAIRRRLEEMDNKTDRSHESSQEALSTPVLSVTPVMMEATQFIEDKRDYINAQLQRSEHICDLLVRFFEDIVLKGARVDIEHSHQLKNCRTLIDFINSIICQNCDTGDIESASERLSDLQTILENIKRDLITTSMTVSSDYAQLWINEIDKAERSELKEVLTAGSKSALDEPGNGNVGYARVTLSKSIPKEKVEEVSRMFRVLVKPENSVHFVVRGEKQTVKKAIKMLYQIQSSNT